MRTISVIVSVAIAVTGCTTEFKSNLVVARPAQGCMPGQPGCYLVQMTDQRPGRCWDQRPSPGEQILRCTDETSRRLTTAGKTWITIGAVTAGVLSIVYVWFVVYAFSHAGGY